MIKRETFFDLDLSEFEHAKKYAQLLNSDSDKLLISANNKTVDDLLNKSIKMGTLNFKHNNKYFDVAFRNISGNTFAFYPETRTVIIGASSLERLLR